MGKKPMVYIDLLPCEKTTGKTNMSPKIKGTISAGSTSSKKLIFRCYVSFREGVRKG